MTIAHRCAAAFLALAFMLVLTGCSSEASTLSGVLADSPASALPPASESFLVVENPDAASGGFFDPYLADLPSDRELTAQDRYFVALKKSALERDFLLHGATIPQNGAATGQALRGRIV